MSFRNRRGLQLVAVLAFLAPVLIFGCSGGKPPVKLYQVSGTLKRQGKPVPNLLVHFDPEKGAPSTAVAAADGTFKLNYQKDRPGVVPGTHKVWVEYRPKTPEDDMAMREGKLDLPDGLAEVLEKFGPATSELQVKIDGDNKNLVISLD